MGSYPVMKCFCCENKYSEIEVLRLSIFRQNVIAHLIAKNLKKIEAKGTVQIVEMDQMIVGAIYDYADQHEVNRADEICQEIERTFEDLDVEIRSACETTLIDVDLTRIQSLEISLVLH